MLPAKTHREVRNPQISARFLADYMAASETAKRTVVRGCKYQPIARVVQHDEAKLAVARFIRSGHSDIAVLGHEAQTLRDRMADSEFDRDVLDHNADYIDRFASVASSLVLPSADLLVPGKAHAIELNGVRIPVEIHFRLRRVTQTNRVRVGAAMLRYAKGKALAPAVGEWQSAFLLGYLNLTEPDDSVEPERKLCLTIDAYSGVSHSAPSDSVRRFQNMKAACATIAERWPAIAPPLGAVI